MKEYKLSFNVTIKGEVNENASLCKRCVFDFRNRTSNLRKGALHSYKLNNGDLLMV